MFLLLRFIIRDWMPFPWEHTSIGAKPVTQTKLAIKTNEPAKQRTTPLSKDKLKGRTELKKKDSLKPTNTKSTLWVVVFAYTSPVELAEFSVTFPWLLYCAVVKLVGLLVTIAFYTLAERKIMGAVQRRHGPDVVGWWGLLQPLADGLKLLAKEFVIPSQANGRLFILAPLSVLTLALLSWGVVPFELFDHSETISTEAALKLLKEADKGLVGVDR